MIFCQVYIFSCFSVNYHHLQYWWCRLWICENRCLYGSEDDKIYCISSVVPFTTTCWCYKFWRVWRAWNQLTRRGSFTWLLMQSFTPQVGTFSQQTSINGVDAWLVRTSLFLMICFLLNYHIIAFHLTKIWHTYKLSKV